MVPDINKVRFPQRKNPRLKDFDYASANCYFVTVCTHDKAWLFGPPGGEKGWGLLAAEGFLQLESHFPEARVEKFVIMPNHVHALIFLNGEGRSLPVIIGQYKSYVSRQIRGSAGDIQVWQASFHDHVVRTREGYQKIWQYIDSNPMTWEKDCFFEENTAAAALSDPALQEKTEVII